MVPDGDRLETESEKKKKKKGFVINLVARFLDIVAIREKPVDSPLSEVSH